MLTADTTGVDCVEQRLVIELYNPNGLAKPGIYDNILARGADVIVISESHATTFFFV